MTLTELLKGVNYTTVEGSTNRDVAHLTFDSRAVAAGSCFIAIEGSVVDGHNYIQSAVEKGAVAVVCKRLPEILDTSTTTYIVTDDTDKATAQIAANFYGNPSHKLKVVGVTGTNGKTTIATLLYDLVRIAFQVRCPMASRSEGWAAHRARAPRRSV